MQMFPPAALGKVAHMGLSVALSLACSVELLPSSDTQQLTFSSPQGPPFASSVSPLLPTDHAAGAFPGGTGEPVGL